MLHDTSIQCEPYFYPRTRLVLKRNEDVYHFLFDWLVRHPCQWKDNMLWVIENFHNLYITKAPLGAK